MKKVLLHTCCGICAFYSLNKLKEEDFQTTVFFFNPNIYPESEYLKRKEVIQKVSEITSVEMLNSVYDERRWKNVCQGYENEPEGGKRCLLCYDLRLKETFRVCRENNFDYFTTALTISPHKSSKIILEKGKELGGDYFLAIDFKKNDGFKKTMDLAKKYNLYRQSYCGCEYSKWRSNLMV